MSIRRIEVPIFGKDSFDTLLDAARTVASRFDAQIETRFIRLPASDAALYDAGFGFASASLIDQIEKEGLAAAEAAKQRFDAWLSRHTVRPRIFWHEEEGELGAVVARRGCLADMVLLQRAGSKDAAIDEPFEAAVYGAGSLAMVADDSLSERFLDHLLIAWNDSTEASRAVALSIPFLQAAGKVSIFTTAEPDASPADAKGLVEYLALHNIAAEPLEPAPHPGGVADSLLSTAQRIEATALVMGAYTHGRVRQLLFGGLTQHIITKGGLPALLAH